VNGIPVLQLIDIGKMDEIIARTRDGGAEILALRKTSSAYDAPGAAVVAMIDAISHDRKRILPCVAILENEYRESDIAMGVPCILGAAGLEKVIELQLNEDEMLLFRQSVFAIRGDLERLTGH
jgi:malate dehydrogenase